MKALFDFTLALAAKGFPWLALIVVVAIAVSLIAPIRLNLSIGERSGKRGR